MPNRKLQKGHGGDLYKPRFPAGETIEPPVEVGEEPSFRPEVEKGVEAEPRFPVSEQPSVEPETLTPETPEVQPEERVAEEEKLTPTRIGKSAVESAEKGEFAQAVDKLERAQKGGSNETEQ